MTENFLQYLWNYKLFTNFNFLDTEGNAVEIADFGKFNTNSGPDFSFGKIRTKGVTLAGNIELHLKSSDWKLHRHRDQPEYKNVILHAVFSHDMPIPELVEARIPTIELKNYISEATLARFSELLNTVRFIPCEEIFRLAAVSPLFAEQKVLEKLEAKSVEIEFLLKQNKNDYEAVLFQKLAYAFGLKVNAEIFQQAAASLVFSHFRKISRSAFQAEALLFGKTGLLSQNPECAPWLREFEYLQKKFRIGETVFRAKFMRLRPVSFPTIRLSQLAALYSAQNNLFSKIISAQNLSELKQLFSGITASEYWNTRFNFGPAAAENSPKKLSEAFVEIVLLNAVLPFIYTYNKNLNPENAETILDFYREIKAEKNTVLENWKKVGAPVSSALDSQAFLYHKKVYCDTKNCLNCSIGYQLLKHV